MIVEKTNGEFEGLEKLREKLKSLQDGKYWIEIKENRPSRSHRQNRYYWGTVLKILSDEIGYTPEEMHQIMAAEFLSYEKYGRRFVQSTTQLNTKEFEEYMENIRRFASVEMSVWIPEPGEDYEVY